MNTIKRAIAILLSAVMMLGVCSAAFAAETSGVTIKPSATVFIEGDGDVEIGFDITNNTAGNLTLVRAATRNGVIESIGAVPKTDITPNGGTAKVTFFVKVDATAEAGNKANQQLTLYFLDSTGAEQYKYTEKFTIYKSSTPANPDGGGGTGGGGATANAGSVVRVSRTGEDGKTVPAPSGDYGNNIRIRLPLTCDNWWISNLVVTPIITTDLNTFPFDISLTDYTLTYPSSIGSGEVVEFNYDLTLSKKVTAGTKKVDFLVVYTDNLGVVKNTTLSIFVNVKKGVTGEAGADGAVSTPRLIIQSYSIDKEKIYAGDTFTVTFNIINTSSAENVQNIQMRITDAANVLLPANNGSNTVYINKIAKGETHTEKLSLQTAPDIESKAYTLNIAFAYEGSSSVKPFTGEETVTLPIVQKIRIKTDAPTVYDEPWVGQPAAMACALYNLGKSTINNCMVTIEGEGVSMEEAYFGGNVTSGGTMRADFNVIPSVAGEVKANVVITYEDSYGEQFTEKLPFTMNVQEQMPMDPMDPALMQPEEPVKKGFPLWLWFIIGPLVPALAVAAVILIKRKRAKELEDVDL
ncbi:MAG: hypothetical protein RR232_05645 [Clostridia bacterium]